MMLPTQTSSRSVDVRAAADHRNLSLPPRNALARSIRTAVSLILLGAVASGSASATLAGAQDGVVPPRHQSMLAAETAGPHQPLSLRDAARDDRWLGLGVSDVRWALDGSAVWFRWNDDPKPGDDPEADPWYRAARDGSAVTEIAVTEAHGVPPSSVGWSRDGRRAAWTEQGTLWVYDAGGGADGAWAALALASPARSAAITPDGAAVHFMMGEDLFGYDVDAGTVRQITRKHVVRAERQTPAEEWLADQQLELFERFRREQQQREEAAARELQSGAGAGAPQPIPVPAGLTITDLQLSPDGGFVTVEVRRNVDDDPPTSYMDYLTESGQAQAESARQKVGAAQDEVRFGIVAVDPAVDADHTEVTWVRLDEAGERDVIVHGPWWSLEGDHAVIQVRSADHNDLWIAELDMASGATRVLAHDHDDAWLGGPPIQPNNVGPTLFEWLPGGRFVFASERTGWSHLYLVDVEASGAPRTSNTSGASNTSTASVQPLTSGAWEVRGATLSRDRTKWLITAGREHPSDDHLYVMPADGGELVRLTDGAGRHDGILSPDGGRLAIVASETVQLPDLYLADPAPGAASTRITVSGTDNYYRHPLKRPEIVSFEHPDGGPLWAALFQPENPNAERAAVIHVHGGGYRQFAHRGWSVYGYADHLGLINYLLGQGYTVLDFDYRGSAGFGRDYRTDIYRAMGISDVDGGVAAVRYLVREHGIDPSRVGVYGVSYGGFFTLMAMFRHPGVFAAGVANAAVSDWAHYNHGWTSRILNLPYEDPEAYRTSSPIYHAEGLADALLIVHSLTDSNVQFQDTARLVQRLIELEKDFEVMFYPREPHVIETEESRYDYVRRVTRHFERYLLRR